MIGIAELWHSRDPKAWDAALKRYWDFVSPANLELERRMESLDIEHIRRFDAQAWYDFLLNEYFRWKYTAPNRYATTTRFLRRYAETNSLAELERIKEQLLGFELSDIAAGLKIASQIKGLGPAGASGLLALMFPGAFGTADQFVVKALRSVGGFPESGALTKMEPEQLTLTDAVMLIASCDGRPSKTTSSSGWQSGRHARWTKSCGRMEGNSASWVCGSHTGNLTVFDAL